MFVHSVSRVPPPMFSSSHRMSNPSHLYSSTSGASARVTVVSLTRTAGAPTVVSFTLLPTLPRLPSASNGAHSRRCSGSVSACQTFSGACCNSLTRISLHFSPSFRICAPLAGPGVYCSRSLTFLSFSFPTQRTPLPALQLRNLNQIAAAVLQHRNRRAGHVRRRHRELGPAPLDPLVIALDVVGEEHRRWLALFKDRLLIGLGCGVVVQRQLQLRAVRLLGRGHRQPPIGPLRKVCLLYKPQHLRIEPQRLLLVVHIHAGHFDFHSFSPLPCFWSAGA